MIGHGNSMSNLNNSQNNFYAGYCKIAANTIHNIEVKTG